MLPILDVVIVYSNCCRSLLEAVATREAAVRVGTAIGRWAIRRVILAIDKVGSLVSFHCNYT